MAKTCGHPMQMAKKSNKKKSKSWYEVEDGVGLEIHGGVCA